MADSTLAAIQLKVRRLTRSPSTAMLTDATINEYVNTFIEYDFPEHLRLFSLKTTFEFYTTANVDTYPPSTVATDPLYQFDQRYITFEGPVYIAGFEAKLSQSREEFYRIFPFVNSVASTQLVGDGVTVAFNGTLSAIPVLQNQVVFTAQDATGNSLVLTDQVATGVPAFPTGNLTSPDGVSTGTINYITGAFTLNWGTAPAAQAVIYSETYPYSPGRPTLLLYYDDQFQVRPIPDKAYKVILNAYIRPTELLAAGDSPELEQWWQYIAYGAAKKVREDRMDLDTVQLIMPEFLKQQNLVLRRTLVQQANQRVATIYVNQVQPTGTGYNPYGNPF